MADDFNPSLNVPPGMGGPPPQIQVQQPQVQAQPAPPDPQQAGAMHDTLFGKAAKALLGNDNQFSVDAQGNMQNNPVPQKPGNLFRQILGAAILGGAAGANGNPAQGFAGGAVRGGQASIQNAQQQDQMKQAQAQRDFQNRQAAAKESREATSALSEEQLRKAQLAEANANTYRINVLTQGANFTQHQDVANAGKQHFSDYQAAGLKPVMQDVSESDMQQTMKNRPGAGTLDWEPTGVKVSLDAQGNPTHEYTYSAYDPKGQIPVSQGTIDRWKKDGMDKYYPELFSVVKAGKPLDVNQYVTLKKTDERLYGDNLARTTNDNKLLKETADIKNTNAETASHLATAMHERAATGQIQQEKTKQQAFSNALGELNKVGGDFDKLTPKSKIIIGESAASQLPAMETEVKSLLNDVADPESQQKAKDLMSQMDSIRTLSMGAIRHGGVAPEKTGPTAKPNAGIDPGRYDTRTIYKAVQIANGMPKEKALAAIDSASTYSDAEKMAIKNKINNPEAETPNLVRDTPYTK